MSIYDGYTDREALLKDVAAEIAEETNENGETVYRLPNKLAETLRAKYDAEVKNARSQREKKQEAESQLAELRQLREKDQLELDELRKLNPADMRATLERYVNQSAESASRIKALESELKPLRAQNAEFKKKAERDKIESELVENALKMNCCETALRDVKRLAPMFKLNDAGVATTEDGKLILEVLQEEVERSPHWLKRSQSANASPGAAGMSSESRFREALRGKSFADVLNNAPRKSLNF